MSQDGAYLLAVVCEAAADRRVSTGLADRVLCREVPWIESDSLDVHRRWRGLDETSSYLPWRWIRSAAKERGLKAHGHFQGEPGALDAHAARLALLLLATGAGPPDAVVLIRDSDGHEERQIGLRQARDERRWPFPIAIGLAHPNRESWALAGFEPRNEGERRSLAEIERELGFDPRLRAHALRAQPGEARNAKLILERLVGRDPDREEECWMSCDLEILRARGAATGLADYMNELRERIVPVFGPPAARHAP
jgi:hypothetical protein